MVERLGTGAGDTEQAARALRSGRLVAFPTETVYGLGAVATNDRAVAAIFMPGHDPRWYWRHARRALRPSRGEGMREAAEAYNAQLASTGGQAASARA